MNVLITGASKGIGKSLAMKFASEGYDLIICARDEKELMILSNELKLKFQIQILHYASDLSDKKSCKLLGEWIREKKMDIDILINNCGQFVPGSIHSEEDGILEKMISVNLYSAYNVTRAVISGMISKKMGHIFNICSIASYTAYPNGGSYSISKFAMAGFSKNLREEMKSHNIKVTTVYPGAVYTKSWEGSGVDKGRILETTDISTMIYAASQLSIQACVEEIIVRPQLGDV